MKRVCILALVITVSCLGAWAQNDPASLKVLKVGVLVPMSGAWQSGGIEAEAALQLAMLETNAFLAPLGLAIELVIRDTGSDPAAALEGMRFFKEAGIFAVVGPYSSDEAKAVVAYANENGMIVISPSSTAQELCAPDNLFRLCPSDAHQAQALAMLMQEEGITNVALVLSDDLYGHGLEAAFLEKLANIDGKPAGSIAFPATGADYAETARKLEELAATIKGPTTGILFIGSDAQGTALLEALPAESAAASLRWYASEGLTMSPLLTKSAAGGAMAAKVGLSGYALSGTENAFYIFAQYVRQQVAAKIGHQPTPYAAMSWDAMMLLGDLYRTLPDGDSAAFKNALPARAENLYGTLGLLGLDENGDRKSVAYALYRMVQDPSGPVWRWAGSFEKAPGDSPSTSLIPMVALTAPKDAEGAVAKVGVLLPQPNSGIEWGREMTAALDLAKQQINEYLSSQGRLLRMEVIVAEAGADPVAGLEQLKQLYAQGAHIVIAAVPPIFMPAFDPFLDETGLPLIFPLDGTVAYARRDSIMRLVPNNACQARAVSQMAAKAGITRLIAIYPRTRYARDFYTALAQEFTGTVDAIAIDTAQIDNVADIQQRATAQLEQAISQQPREQIGIIAIGSVATLPLLQSIPMESPLLTVSWFGSDFSAMQNSLPGDALAAERAAKVNFTCSAYSLEGFGLFLPQLETLNRLLQPALSAHVSLIGINTYDALWLAARAYEGVGVDASPDQLWVALQRRTNHTGGMSGPMQLDINDDRLFSAFTFQTLIKTDAGYSWKVKALSRDAAFASDVVMME